MDKQKRTSPKKENQDKKNSYRKVTDLTPKKNIGHASDNASPLGKNFKQIVPVVLTIKVQPTGICTSRTGKVNFYNAEKGYGFIKDQVTHETYFVYRGCLREMINANDVVSFEIEKTPGGLTAVNVHRVVLPPSGN